MRNYTGVGLLQTDPNIANCGRPTFPDFAFSPIGVPILQSPPSTFIMCLNTLSSFGMKCFNLM